MRTKAIQAKKAAYELSKTSLIQRDTALILLIENLSKERSQIFKANQQDKALAKKAGLEESLLERLCLENRFEGILQDLQKILSLPDPIGEIFEEQILPNQLNLAKCRIPIGVLGVIYESRPNVTLDISALCIKSGNCALLRGGSETLLTNQILVEMIQRSLQSASLPVNAIQLIATSDRSQIYEMLQQHECIDLIIPRGSQPLQQFCRENSKIPLLTGGVGVCHLFVDESAQLEKSLDVILNAKTQRPSVCNALDTLLVHAAVAADLIPSLIHKLKKKGVSFRCDETAKQLAQDPSCTLAIFSDWDTEWLGLVMGIKVVKNIQEAIEHIRLHSSGHSDGIFTENSEHETLFVKAIDSAVVYVNASTRFTDGSQFGLGGEVAISTQKLHARGPVGLKELTSYKWIVKGNYQSRI